MKNKKIYTDFELLPDKFLLFPLNMPYDEQLLLRAPGFEDNYSNIKFIMNNFPSDSSLVIKEHPVNPGMLSNKARRHYRKNTKFNFHFPDIPLRDILIKVRV